MHGYVGKTNTVDEDMIDARIRNEREDTWGPMDGEIVSFDPAKQTATVRPFYKKRLAGVATQVPDLQEVPVEFDRGGGGAITRPVKAGDKVRLTPKMRNSTGYDEGGGAFEAEDERSFNLSDYVASLHGGNSLSDPIQNFDADNFHARFDDAGEYGIRGSADGKIKIEGSEGNIYDLLAQVVELLAADTLTITHGSSLGNGHRLEFQAQYAAIAAKLRAMAL